LKLFLTWLLGVPVLVLAMVVARAMSPYGLQAAPRTETQPPKAVIASVAPCTWQDDLHEVRPLVAQDPHRIACDLLTIK
jgi:hypothetical protein